jgi:hypothetical protein
MHRRILAGSLAGIAVITCGMSASAQFRAVQTLKGIEQVCVSVEDFTSEALAAGVDSAAVQTQVELRLREAGIRVVKCESTRALPTVYVNINVGPSRGVPGVWYIAYSLALIQAVALPRLDISTRAITWQTGGAGTFGASRLTSTMREATEHLLDDFANDWLSVNPR